MSDVGALVGIGIAGLFGIYADLAMNIASATNSSPQTTELFAGQRSETLWKWVKIGGATAVGFGILGSVFATLAEGKLNVWPLIATVTVIGVMGVMYKYALKWGQEKNTKSPKEASITYLHMQGQ